MNLGVKNALASAALACSFIFGAVAQAADSAIDTIVSSNELKVCFEAGYLPFEMKTKDGRFIGFDIDIAKHMARSMDVKFVPVNTAWDGIIPALQTGKCEIIIGGMTITAQRNLKVMFSDPYIKVGQTVLINPKLAGEINSYRDLNNAKYKIATQLGTTGAEAVKKYLPKAQTNLFETSADAVLQVTNGKADAFVYDLPYNALYASQHGDQVIHLEETFTYEPLGWAIRQNDPNFLNNYLKQIQNDGTYARIYKKWFESDAWLSSVQ